MSEKNRLEAQIKLSACKTDTSYSYFLPTFWPALALAVPHLGNLEPILRFEGMKTQYCAPEKGPFVLLPFPPTNGDAGQTISAAPWSQHENEFIYLLNLVERLGELLGE